MGHAEFLYCSAVGIFLKLYYGLPNEEERETDLKEVGCEER